MCGDIFYIIIYRVFHAEICGTKYAKGNVLICGISNGDPIFGKILDILVTTCGDCLFVLTPYIASTFNRHFNSYEVEQLQNEFLICHHQDFVDYHRLSLHKSFDTTYSKNFINLKYHVF